MGEGMAKRTCFLLEDDPEDAHGKPIACTQCWNAVVGRAELLEDQVQNLAALVRRLIRKVPGSIKLKEQASDYLRRNSLHGGILREVQNG